jgi:hypothetical protein
MPIPFISTAADLTNAAIYASQGQYGEAAMSAVGSVPLIGDAAKWAAKGLATAGMAAVAAKTARKSEKAFSAEKQALVEMAKLDKKLGGMTPGDMDAYKDLNKGLSDAFPKNQVRGPEAHPLRTPNSTPGPGQLPHGHVGPVDHIPIKEPTP